MNRDIVEVLREGAKAYADEVGGGHAYRYTRAADEIERLRSDLATARRLGWQPDKPGEMVSCDPAPHAARGLPAHGLGRTYKL